MSFPFRCCCRRLRCYCRLDDYYTRENPAYQINLRLATVRQLAGRCGRLLLGVSEPHPYDATLPPTEHVFEAASVDEMQRWSRVTRAAPLADTYMRTALGPDGRPDGAAAHGRLQIEAEIAEARAVVEVRPLTRASPCSGRTAALAQRPSLHLCTAHP